MKSTHEESQIQLHPLCVLPVTESGGSRQVSPEGWSPTCSLATPETLPTSRLPSLELRIRRWLPRYEKTALTTCHGSQSGESGEDFLH